MPKAIPVPSTNQSRTGGKSSNFHLQNGHLDDSRSGHSPRTNSRGGKTSGWNSLIEEEGSSEGQWLGAHAMKTGEDDWFTFNPDLGQKKTSKAPANVTKALDDIRSDANLIFNDEESTLYRSVKQIVRLQN